MNKIVRFYMSCYATLLFYKDPQVDWSITYWQAAEATTALADTADRNYKRLQDASVKKIVKSSQWVVLPKNKFFNKKEHYQFFLASHLFPISGIDVKGAQAFCIQNRSFDDISIFFKK